MSGWRNGFPGYSLRAASSAYRHAAECISIREQSRWSAAAHQLWAVECRRPQESLLPFCTHFRFFVALLQCCSFILPSLFLLFLIAFASRLFIMVTCVGRRVRTVHYQDYTAVFYLTTFSKDYVLVYTLDFSQWKLCTVEVCYNLKMFVIC